MFSLQIHSVDTNHPLTEFAGEQSGAPIDSASANPNPNIQERRGIIHLFRSVSRHSTSVPPNLDIQSTTELFVVAVPNHLSSDDFIRFCGSYIDSVVEMLLIRNDGIEDRYSVLIKLVDQKSADNFYSNLNGRRFSSMEAEVCHILFTISVEYTELAEIAGMPPVGFTELPTCPVCLERLDQDTSGILTTLCDHSFQCACISRWTHSSCPVCRFCQQQAEKPTCSICGTSGNLWICVICGFVGCGRYKEGHAIRHWKDTQHCYSLDLETQRVWDYVGDSYVHRLNQSKTDSKLVELNARCRGAMDGDCGTYECSEDPGISEDSKVEASLFDLTSLGLTWMNGHWMSKVWFGGSSWDHIIMHHLHSEIFDEYNRLLATQLENQRQYYETLLVEAKGKKEKAISEAVEKAITLNLQDIQFKLDKCVEEKKAVSEMHENLLKNQELLRQQVEETEDRERSTMLSMAVKMKDLEEQIRDLSVYIEAQKTVANLPDSDDIKGGTLLPVRQQSSPSPSTSSTSNTKKNKNSRTNRRRK